MHTDGRALILTSAYVICRSLRTRPSGSIKGSTLHPLTKNISLHQTFQVSESSRMSHSHASSRGSQIISSTTYQISSYGSWSTDRTRRFDLMFRSWTTTQAKVSTLVSTLLESRLITQNHVTAMDQIRSTMTARTADLRLYLDYNPDPSKWALVSVRNAVTESSSG